MSLPTNTEDIEKMLSKIFASSKEKLLNDLLYKFDKNKNELYSLNVNWGDILIQRNSFIHHNPYCFFKLFNKLMELKIQHFIPYMDIMFEKLFTFQLDTQLKMTSLTYLSSSIELSTNIRNNIFNTLQLIIFENIINDELHSSSYEILYNIFNKIDLAVPFQIDFVIETCIILVYNFILEKNEPQSIATLTIGNILRPNNNEKNVQLTTNIQHLTDVFQFYLLKFKGIRHLEILKHVLSFILYDFEKTCTFLKEYYNVYPQQFTKVIYHILTSNEEYVNFDDLNKQNKDLNFFSFAISDNMYDQGYKTKIENYTKAYNVFIMKKKEKIKMKIQREKIIINALKCIRFIIEDTSTSLSSSEQKNEYSLYVKIPFTFILSSLDELLFKKVSYLKEIIFVMQALVTHYGKFLYDEWDIIFKMLKQIIERKVVFTDIEKTQSIEYIFSQIYSLYLFQYFNGNINQMKELVSQFPKITDENLHLFRIKFSLETKEKFIYNIEKLISDYFKATEYNSSDYIKNYLLEILRYNYVFSIKANSHIELANIIEDKVNFSLDHYLVNIKNENNFVYISYLLSEMLFYTKNISFFKDIITKLFSKEITKLFLHNSDFKKETYHIYHTLLIDTLRTVITKLNNTFQNEKLYYIIKQIFSRKRMESIVYFRTALKLVTHLIINKDLFIHFAYNKEYSHTNITFPCCLIFDYNHQEIKKQKTKYKTKDEYIVFKKNYYSPFIAFNFEKIFTFFTSEFNKPNSHIMKNNHILYELFEFYNNSLTNVFTLNTPKIPSMFDFYIDLSNKKEMFFDKAIKTRKMREMMLQVLLNYINIQNPQTQSVNRFMFIDKCILLIYLLWNKDKNVIKDKLKKLNFVNTKNFTTIDNAIEELGDESQQNRKVNEYPNEIKQHLKNSYKYLQIIKLYLFSLGNYNKLIPDEVIELLGNQLINAHITELLPCAYLKQKFAIAIISLLYQGKYCLTKMSSDVCMKIVLILLLLIFQTKEKFIVETFEKHYPKVELGIKIDSFENNYLKQIKLNKKKSFLKKRLIEYFGQITLLYYIRYVKQPGVFLNVIRDIYKEMNMPKVELFVDLCKWNLYSGNNRDNCIKAISEMNHDEKIRTQIYIAMKTKSIIMLNPISNRSCCLSLRNPIYNISLIIDNFDNKDYDEKIRVNTRDGCIYAGKFHDDFEYIFRYKKSKMNINNDKQTTNKKHRSKSSLLPHHKQQLKYITFTNPQISNNKPFKYNNINTKSYPNPIQNSNILFHQIANLSSQPIKTFYYMKFKSQTSKLHFLNEISPLDTMSLLFTHHIGISFLPNISNIKENDIYSYDGEVSKSYILFLQKMGETISSSSLQNIYLGNTMSTTDSDYILKYNDTICQIVFHVSNLIKDVKKRKEIIKHDKVCILYVDKYFIDYSNIFNDNVNTMVYILIIPISSSNVIVSIQGNAKAKEVKLMERIEKVFSKKFVLEVTNVNCYSIIREIACEIALFVKMYGDVLDKENVGKKEDTEGNTEVDMIGFKEMCGIDNRMQLIKEVFMKYELD